MPHDVAYVGTFLDETREPASGRYFWRNPTLIDLTGIDQTPYDFQCVEVAARAPNGALASLVRKRSWRRSNEPGVSHEESTA